MSLLNVPMNRIIAWHYVTLHSVGLSEIDQVTKKYDMTSVVVGLLFSSTHTSSHFHKILATEIISSCRTL